MSMIDCKINVERKEDPKGDRVLLTFEYIVPYSHPSNAHISFLVANSFHMRGGKQLMPTK